ncbi:MAG: hypothetical protein RLZZ292_88 [Bacteroidota bacterium]|jgi:hypothetical protein
MNRFLPYLIIVFFLFYTSFSTQAVVENRFVLPHSVSSVVVDSIILPEVTSQPISKDRGKAFNVFDKASRWMIFYPLIFVAFQLIFGGVRFRSFGGLSLVEAWKLLTTAFFSVLPLYLVRWQIRKYFADQNYLNKEREALSRRTYVRFAWVYFTLFVIFTLARWYSITFNPIVFSILSYGGSFVGKNRTMEEAVLKEMDNKKEFLVFKPQESNLIPMKKKDKYGYQLKNGKVAIEAKYQMTTVFSEGLAQVKLNDKWGYVNEHDVKIIDFEYDEAQPFSEGLAAVQQKGKYGYINQEGKLLIPCVYDAANDFKGGMATVWRNGQSENITSPNEWIKPIHPTVTKKDTLTTLATTLTKPIDNKVLILLERAGKYGFQDTDGNVVIPVKYQIAYSFSEGLAQVRLNDKWGFINKEGKSICSFEYEDCNAFREGLAVVQTNGKYGYINKQGKIVFPCIYDSASDFKDGQARVEIKGQKEVIVSLRDEKSKSVLLKEPIVPTPIPEPELRLVERSGKFGFKDLDGNTVILPKYTIAYDFSEGLAQVQLDNKWGFINKKGEIICPIQYDDCNAFSEGMAVVQKNGVYGYINLQGKTRLFPQYSSASNFRDGTAYVEKDGRKFRINTQGKELVD